MILVKTLRKINQVLLICVDVQGTQTLANLFQNIWKDCAVPLFLSYPATGAEDLKQAVNDAKLLLTKSGCTVSVYETQPANSRADAEDLSDYGLVAIALEKTVKKDSNELRWLDSVKTSALLAFR